MVSLPRGLHAIIGAAKENAGATGWVQDLVMDGSDTEGIDKVNQVIRGKILPERASLHMRDEFFRNGVT